MAAAREPPGDGGARRDRRKTAGPRGGVHVAWASGAAEQELRAKYAELRWGGEGLGRGSGGNEGLGSR